MTDQQINEAVARKLGWDPDTFPGQVRQHLAGGTLIKDCPHYCSSIEAAWEIVEFVGRFRFVSIWREPNQCNRVYARFPADDEQDYKSEADTAPMAICKAFLKLPDDL